MPKHDWSSVPGSASVTPRLLIIGPLLAAGKITQMWLGKWLVTLASTGIIKIKIDSLIREEYQDMPQHSF